MNYHHFIILFLLFFEFDKIQAWTRNILTQTRKYKTSFMTTDYRAKSNEVSDFRISQHSRREWLIDIFKGSFMGSLTNIKKVLAAEMPASMSLCDPSISTWCHPPTNRIVHIIGTAHISTSSAALASQVVKEIRPNAVFIELDKRRLIPGGLSMSSLSSSSVLSSFDSYKTDTVHSFLENLAVTSIVPHAYDVSVVLFNPLEAAVGNALRGYYDKLDRAGYKSGEEFILAMKSGLDVGAVIVLGDQDAKLTLRRLTQALLKTDMQKLLEPDSELEQSLKALVPGGDSGNIPSLSELNDPASRQKLSEYVEIMKAKDTIKGIMKHLKRAALEIYQVMVADRDTYMAKGIHSLYQFPVTVAVMGMAHVDGVEENLRSLGWKPIHYSCPKK